MRAADYWDDALTIDAYLSQMTQRREQFDAGIAGAEITPDLRRVFGGRSLRFLILTEDYCGDSAQFIPPVMRLARELENVDARIVLRDSRRELAAGYLRKDGYQPIPVFIILDEDGNELGTLLERPARMYPEMAAETRRYALENAHLEGVTRTYAQMPPETRAAVLANMDRYRDVHRERYIAWLWEDLAAIVAEAGARQAAAAD